MTKSTEKAFRPALEAAHDRLVLEAYASSFGRALRWFDRDMARSQIRSKADGFKFLEDGPETFITFATVAYLGAENA